LRPTILIEQLINGDFFNQPPYVFRFLTNGNALSCKEIPEPHAGIDRRIHGSNVYVLNRYGDLPNVSFRPTAIKRGHGVSENVIREVRLLLKRLWNPH